MKFLLKIIAAIAVYSLTGSAYAAPNASRFRSDETVIGPVTVPVQYKGVTLDPNVMSYFNISSKPDGIYLNARIEADLSNLQNNFGSVMDRVPLPSDNCASKGIKNLVVRLPSRSLAAQGDAALIKLSGEAVSWTCLDNPIPQTYWDPNGCSGDTGFLGHIHYSFGCPKFRPGNPIKTINATQPFDFSVPVTIVSTDGKSITLVVGNPNVTLGGQFAFITNGILHIANIDLNAEAKSAIESAVNPAVLTATIPAEYAELNPAINSVHFGVKDGNLAVFIEMSARIPPKKLNDMILGMMKKPKT